MLIQSAKTRNTIHTTAANRRSPTSSQSRQKLNACATTAKTGCETTRNVRDLKIGSCASWSSHLYGSRQSQSVRQAPSLASLFGSPAWSENLWCRRCRFTQLVGLMYTPKVLLTTVIALTNHSL